MKTQALRLSNVLNSEIESENERIIPSLGFLAYQDSYGGSIGNAVVKKDPKL